MRVLLSFLQSLRRHPVSAYEHWRTYLVNGCQEAGISCVEVPQVDWVQGLLEPPGQRRKAWLTETWEKVLAFVQTEHARRPLDLFLSYLYPQMVDCCAIRELQRLGIPCVNFFCDNVREFRNLPSEFRCFDLHWVPEYQALDMYGKAGLKFIHAAMPCWVPPEHRNCIHPETEGVTFIGSPDDLRRHLFAQAIGLGAKIDVYGPGWHGKSAQQPTVSKSLANLLRNQWNEVAERGLGSWLLKFERRFCPLPQPPAMPPDRLRGKLSAEDFLRVMQRSEVTLGVNRVATSYRSVRKPLTYSRLRDIEAPMMGSCYLTEWAEDLEHLYDIGTEIEVYRSAEELKAKLDALHKDATKRSNLRRLGQRRALLEHTVGRSLERILAEIG